MTLYQFNQLPEREQEIAMKEAVLLADREQGHNAVYLFGLHGFYVEIYCNAIDPSLNRYRSFSSVDQLAPYLDQIQIEL